MSESQNNGYHRRCFDTICKEKWGNEFQTFFEKVMKKTDPSFVPIKTHGGEGDWKCDGYSRNGEILYQVYAPQSSILKNAKSKILKDLEGAKIKWGGRFKKWIFVYGTQSIPASLLDFIREQGRRLGVDTELWNEEHIWTRVKQLPHDDRIGLLGISGELYTGDRDKLVEILDIVRGKSIDYEVDPIVFSKSQEAQSKKYIDRYIDDTGQIDGSLESLTCSQILELVLMMFQICHLQAVIVDEYYRSICEPDQAIDLYKTIYIYQTQNVEEARKLVKKRPDKQVQAQILNNLSVCILRDERRGYERYHDAIALLNEAISLHPRNPTIGRNLGLSYMYSSQFDEAESTFKQFLAHNRNHHSLWRSLGAAYAMKIRNLANRTSEEGLRLFALGSDACRMSLELEPNNFGAWLNLTGLHTLVDRNQEALIYVQKAISIDSSRYEAYTDLGYILLKMNNLVEAEDALRKALELKPTHITALVNLGSILTRRAQYVEALDVLDTATSLYPDNELAWYNKGVVLYSLSDWAEAKNAYLELLRLDVPSSERIHLSALWNLAIIEMDHNKDFLKTSQLLEKYLMYNRDRFEVWARLSYCYSELLLKFGEEYTKKAAEAFEEAFTFNRNDADLWNNYGVYQKSMGNPLESRKSYKRAIAIEKHPGYLYNLAGTFVDEDIEESIELCKEALSLQPRYLLALKGLSTLYLMKSDWKKASDYASEAMKLSPNDYKLANNYAVALIGLGQRYEARSILGVWKNRAPLGSLVESNFTLLNTSIEGIKLVQVVDFTTHDFMSTTVRKSPPGEPLPIITLGR